MTDATPTPATPPAPPSTPAEAATQLAALKADPSFVKEFMSGSPTQLQKFKSLHELLDRGDNYDLAIAGQLAPGEVQSSDHVQNIGAASMLTDIGLEPAVIRQALSGKPVSKSEFDTVTKWKASALADHEFTKRLMAGDGEPRRLLTAANIVISNGFKE